LNWVNQAPLIDRTLILYLSLESFVRQTQCHILYVYGRPLKEYRRLSKLLRVCWIYDGELNVCTPNGWLEQI